MVYRFKRFCLWFALLKKRLYKKTSFIVLLLCVPLLVIGLSVVASRSEGVVNVALYLEDPTDPVTTDIISRVKDGSSIIGYTDCSSRAEAMRLVTYGSADAAWIKLNASTPLYSDLPAAHWAYATVMEAALAHSAAGDPETWTSVHGYAEDARLLFDGFDYSIMGEDGQLLTDTTWGNHLNLDTYGNYTSGDADVDSMAKSILSNITNPLMSREEKLEAAFVYVRDGYFYRRNNFYDVGQTGWEVEEARTMYEKGKGNCYNYTAAFCMLARQLGYDANAISGLVGEEQQQHGWVEIPIDGELLIFDTTLESSYLAEDPAWNLKFFGLSYADVPWPYTK